MTLGIATRRRNPSPLAAERYTRAPDEEPLAVAQARAKREIADGTRCGCGLLLPHDYANRVRACTLPKEP